MYLRSNNKIICFVLILCTVPVFCMIAMCIVSKFPEGVVFASVCSIPLLLITLQYWIAFGRKIRLAEEGCIVSFFGYTRIYRWDQIQTKKSARIAVSSCRTGLLYDGILLSCKKERILRNKIFLDNLVEVPTHHPFSLIFIFFKPKHSLDSTLYCPTTSKRREKILNSGFFADEEQLFSLLHSWGVTLDDEKAGEL